MADRVDLAFRALADEHRRGVLAALCRGPLRAGELARVAGLAANAMSFHLRWLKAAGLVSVRREGRWLWYHLDGPALRAWLEGVVQVFGQQEAAATREDMKVGWRGPPDGRVHSGRADVKATAVRRSRRRAEGGGRAARRKVPAVASRGSGDFATEVLPDVLL